MTVMDPRPWSPTGPHVGPDDEDLAMLAPTGEAEDDLGSAILVVHRVGAAACEAVARGPLPDEFQLVARLADARAALAPRLVESVSKSLGRDDAYPDLLARDLFDAGEHGALTVYQACVAKGVAPPLAAQRAGLVYGVPKDDLGRYLAVATDVRAHPVAIADAADRAVAAWASGVVREELDETKINKRSVLEYNQTQVGHEHPKGQAGRFVTTMERPSMVTPSGVGARVAQVASRPVGVLARLRRDGQGGQAPPAELMPVVEAPPVTTAAPARPERKVRQVRTVRRVRSAAPAQAKVRARIKAKPTAKLSAKMKATLAAQRAKPSQYDDVKFDPKEKFDNKVPYERLPSDITLAWALAPSDARALYDAAEGDVTEGQAKRILAGQLTHLGSIYRRGDPTHSDQLARFAREESLTTPETVKITEQELETEGVDPTDADAVMRYALRAKIVDQLARDARGVKIPGSESSISVVKTADAGNHWYAVRKPMMAIFEDEDEPVPHAAEFSLTSESYGSEIRANVHGAGPFDPQADFELDPNQRYIIDGVEETWKDLGGGQGYLLDRYRLSPMEDGADDDDWEEVSHSAPVLTRDVVTWNESPTGHLHPKGADGQWAPRGVLARVRPETTAVEEQLPPARKTRATRTMRTTRSTRSSAPTAQVRATVRAELSAPQRAALKAAAKRVQEQTPPRDVGFPMVLDDRPIHKVMSWRTWGKFLAEHAPGKFVDDVGSLPLTTKAKAALLEHGDQMTGDEVNNWSRHEIMNQVMREHNGAMREVSGMRRTIDPHDDKAWDDLYFDMREYMEAHPEAPVLQVHRGEHPNELRVLSNQRPINDQILIFMPEDLDPERPISLHYVGKARQEDLNRGRWRPDDPMLMIDPHMSVYRAEQRVYRADQD